MKNQAYVSSGVLLTKKPSTSTVKSAFNHCHCIIRPCFLNLVTIQLMADVTELKALNLEKLAGGEYSTGHK